MMGMDKGSTKRGGFFHLFDWNRKSRKKLFSSGSVSPESPKQEKKSKESFSRTRRRLDDDDDEMFGVTSGRRSCDYSCASSMTDEDGMTRRAPGVIARLMGLESMPTPIFSESTPCFDTRSLPDRQRDKRNSEFYINDLFNDKVHKIMETKSQRMPSSPIERFQTEAIPPRSARSVPITHHKLLSPIKNSGYISNKNASYIMEAAAKILDHRDRPSVKHDVSAFGSASATLKVSGNSKNNTIIPQSHRRTRVVESSSTSFESAEFRNQNTGKSSNGADATTGHGKTVSLAIQAKVNVQKRVGLLSSRSSLSQKQENNESESNPLFNNQPNNYKNRQQHKSYTNNTSSLLKQNSQKQNFVSNKANLNSKQSISKQLNTNASSVKKKNPNRIAGSYRFSLVDKEASSSSSSSCLSNNRRKSLTERSYIQSNVIIDEHRYSKQHEDYRSNSSDVVSFTFTAPLNKHSIENRISEDVVEGMCTFNNHSQQNNEYANNEHISSPGMNVITGDALSLLLDQKLRELTRVPEPEPCSSVSEECVSGFDSIDTASVEHELSLLQNDKAGSNFGYGASSVNGQEVEECSSYSDARKDLETSYSSESSNFSESSDMTDGSGRTCSSSIQAQNNFSSSINKKGQSTETDSELSDSACSTITDNSYTSDQFNSNSAKSSNYELDFLEEILHSAQSSIMLGDKINPHLFEKLEENKTKKDKSEKLRRKILFDCANECMEIKYNQYFSTGYQAWLKGIAITRDRTLGREIYDEISKWKSMEEWMIDEVVDQDMSSYFGKWLNYETEASAIGLQIEKEITCCLINEVIVDYLIKPTCR